jgi:molybdate transport system substrate-binding protein
MECSSFARRCCIALALIFAAGLGRAAGEPYVAAAADLKFALDEIALAFTRDTGFKLRLSFGSSGNFARQIAQGAPFQMFFSADERYALQLHESGHAPDRGALYAVGRIALYAPTGSALEPDPELKNLSTAIDAGRIRRFAIANPEHAPYGRAAQEALEHAGLWSGLEGRLLLGENAAQAAQFASSASADGGIVPLSLALAPALAGAGRHALIPASWHQPLRQRVVLLNGAGPTARRFYDYVQQPGARALLARYGFESP